MMVIETNYGKMRGVDMGDYIEYRGVPYAKPPIGERRWKAPQPPESWEGIYEADTFRDAAMQEVTGNMIARAIMQSGGGYGNGLNATI